MGRVDLFFGGADLVRPRRGGVDAGRRGCCPTTARVRDDQYDWLVDDAVGEAHGDLSKSVRHALDEARKLRELLGADDPQAAVRELLKRLEEEELKDIQEDEEQYARRQK